jgi:hypothetical protein
MASATQQTERRRKIRKTGLGKNNKKTRDRRATPKFPIDPTKAGPDSAEKRT